MELELVENHVPSKLVAALMMGDLSTLAPDEKVDYYNRVCESVGLNPLTKPFQYIRLNSKEVLYAGKDCCEQLRGIHNISIQVMSREIHDDIFVVTSRATRIDGRYDESIAAVAICNLKGEAKCNAMMKAETKSKRRVTLSICGLGMLDETEIDSIEAKHKQISPSSQTIKTNGPPQISLSKEEIIAIVSSVDEVDSLDKLKSLWQKNEEKILSLPKEEKDSILNHFRIRKTFLNEEANKTKNIT